jgi:hypothetical protein
MEGIPKLACVEVGRIKARFGQYNLLNAAGQTITVRLGLCGRVNRDSVLHQRIPGADSLRQMVLQPSPGAVVIYPKQLPLEMVAPLELAGGDFLSDLEKDCAAVIMTAYLSRHGQWEPGFELGMAAALRTERVTFFDELKVSFDLPRTIFLNLSDQENGPQPTERFHWALSWLLGRIKVDQLLLARGCSPESLGQNARDYFAFTYQQEVIRGIVDHLTKQPGFNESPDRHYYHTQMTTIESLLADYWSEICPEERNIVKLIRG